METKVHTEWYSVFTCMYKSVLKRQCPGCDGAVILCFNKYGWRLALNVHYYLAIERKSNAKSVESKEISAKIAI